MLKQLVASVVVTGGLVASSSAMALINGELLVGKRWAEVKPKTGNKLGAQSLDKTLGLMLDPIPLVPVAFGVYYIMPGWNKDDFGAKKVEGNELGLSVKAWLPLPGTDFIPYARLNYALNGQVKIDADDGAGGTSHSKYDVKGGGYALHVGVRYDLTGPVDLLLETGISQQKWKASGSPDIDVNSKLLLLGIEAGI